MKAQLVILLCCLVGVYSKCPLQAPVGKLPDGCKVGNLTVTGHMRDIISYTLCNSTADESLLNLAPEYLRFQRMWHIKAPGYLVTAVDLTSKKLMWMVSNLTLSSDSSTIFSSTNRYTQVILPYRKPELSQYSRQHVIEFHVFEEFRDYPWRSYITNNAINAPQFNLSSWIDSQQGSGIRLCGPVAGGSVVAFLQSPAPAPGPGPQPAYPTKPPHRPKGSAANRIVVDGMLLAGFFIVFRVLGF